MTKKELLRRFSDTKPADWHKHKNGGGWVHQDLLAEYKSYIRLIRKWWKLMGPKITRNAGQCKEEA